MFLFLVIFELSILYDFVHRDQDFAKIVFVDSTEICRLGDAIKPLNPCEHVNQNVLTSD